MTAGQLIVQPCYAPVFLDDGFVESDAEDSVTARLDASPEGSALPDGTEVIIEPNGNGWLLHLGADLGIETGHGTWRECSPLGRPVVASGAWQGAAFIADLYVITSPHRVRLTVDATTRRATATWTTSTPDQPRPSGAPPRATLDTTRRRLTMPRPGLPRCRKSGP
jgi:hypothetical protein